MVATLTEQSQEPMCIRLKRFTNWIHDWAWAKNSSLDKQYECNILLSTLCKYITWMCTLCSTVTLHHATKNHVLLSYKGLRLTIPDIWSFPQIPDSDSLNVKVEMSEGQTEPLFPAWGEMMEFELWKKMQQNMFHLAETKITISCNWMSSHDE